MRTELALVCAAVTLVATQTASDAASCVPAFDYAAFGKDQLTFGGGAKTDSYNSANGSYASTRSATGGDVGTNGAGCGAITLNGSPTAVGGDASYGPGGTACAVTGAGSISGTQSALPAPLSLPSVTVPAVGTSQGDQTIASHGTLTLGANATFGSIAATGGSHLVFDAGVYVMSSLSLAGNSDMRVNSGPVVIYVSCTSPSASVGLDLTGGTVLNASLDATDLVFMVAPACATVKVTGGTSASFAVYAPDADVTLTGGGDIYGAVVGKTVTNTGGSAIHHDDALDTLAIGDFTCAANEVSRATPIAAVISGQSALVQGTYEPRSATRPAITTTADVASFTFPFLTGHLRARTTASVGTTASSYSAGTALFDAGATGKIPAVNNTGCSTFNGSCRNVFTTTQAPGTDGISLRPSRVSFKDSNASTLGALIAPSSVVTGITAAHWQTIVRTVLAGRLGGIDRSTAAVIGPSVAAGNASRPTIAYVGSTDGMLHAICASVGGTTESQSNVCPSLGTELWAFMPRVQLPLVRSNTTRIDGSVRVVDAFGDFTAGSTGTRSFRTILTLQTGYSNVAVGAAAAVYALDITDPADPVVLWEYTAPTNTTYELGVGLALAVGPTLVGNTQKNLVVAATNNGGSGGAGLVVTALSLETGARVWQFGHVYPTPPRGISADPNVPASGIPGGATAVDLAAQGSTTDIVVGDLYGSLWRLDATTGTSRTGATTPLFRFSSNRQPIGALPAIYSDGARQLAVFGSGGYADPVAATWRGSSQSLIAVPIAATGPYPLDETSPKLGLRQSLASGTGVFAQVLVVGDEIFVVGDSSDVNASTFGTTGDTGSVMRVNAATGTSTTVVVRGGAGSLARTSTTLFSSSGDRQQELGSGAASTTGPSVDTNAAPRLARLLWLRVNE